MRKLTKYFFDRIKINQQGCWVWQKGKDKDGYGKALSGRSHRISWEHFNNSFLGEYWALHTCDNKSCVNPIHIYKGTAIENSRDTRERSWNEFPFSRVNEKRKKLNFQKAKLIRMLYKDFQWKTTKLAELFKVDRKSIYHVLYNITFKLNSPTT